MFLFSFCLAEMEEEGMKAGTSSSFSHGDFNNKQVTENPFKIYDHDHDHDHEDDDDDHEHGHHQEGFSKFVPGPLLPLKDQLDKDKVFILFFKENAKGFIMICSVSIQGLGFFHFNPFFPFVFLSVLSFIHVCNIWFDLFQFRGYKKRDSVTPSMLLLILKKAVWLVFVKSLYR